MIHPTVHIPENGRLSVTSREAARLAIKDATRAFLASGGRIQRIDIVARPAGQPDDKQRSRLRGVAKSALVAKPRKRKATEPAWYEESIANLKAKAGRP